MKNNIFFFFFITFVLFNLNLSSQELEIDSSKIQYDKEKKITIFQENVRLKDEKGNQLFSDYAKYNKFNGIVKTTGYTKIITSGGFEVTGKNITYDNNKKKIQSSYKTQIKDKDGNKIFVDMFTYSILTNIFFSKGNIKVLDINNNDYNFSEIYIDETKKKIIGSDIKAFLKQDDISISKDNEPRFFANTMTLSKKVNSFEKGIFTYCKNRENDKCPPWTLQSKKIRHDLANKTIYYDNVVLKIYDFPIFFSPKFSHPDPSVKRRSGLLVPSLTSSSTLGTGFGVPYFWNISKDRDLTFTPKLYFNENPLLLAEYKQDFKKSFLVVDTGYTEGYREKKKLKTSGGRAHFFSKFNMNLINEKDKNSDLEINLQKVSNDTYFKIYDLNTSLVNREQNVLENTINYTYQNKDFYLGLTPGSYEDINKLGNLRHEYELPLIIEKNILTSDKYGLFDLETNVKFRNYETNKQSNFFVNDFNWSSNKWLNKLGFVNYLEGQIKTVNYEANNTIKYKNNGSNSELKSAIGYFAKLDLFKNDNINKKNHSLTPKFLLRYSPGHMRAVESGRLSYKNIFNLNKIQELDVIENGLSTSIGFEYKKNNIDKNNIVKNEEFSFSAGQVISEKENMDIPSSSSLDQKFSDVVGASTYKIKENFNLNYNFSLDQNYKQFNYNEVSSDLKFEKVKFNIGYLQERNHIGSQEFVQSEVGININNSTELSFSSKRNLLTSSAEFYNLSYNYINDCLRAGIAYRREFYTDRDIEPTNDLMFTISIVPFAEISSPRLTR